MRRLSLTTSFLCALSLLALFWPITAAAQEKKSALAIFDAALAAFDNQRLALRNWQYHQTLITRQMDSAGNVVASGTWQSIVRPGDPRPLEYTSSRVEGKLSFFKAQTPSSPAPSGTKATKTPEEKNQTESAVEAVRRYNLRDRYKWRRLPDENVAGESAYVISFGTETATEYEIARGTVLWFAGWPGLGESQRLQPPESRVCTPISLPSILDHRAGHDLPVYLQPRACARRAAALSYEPSHGENSGRVSVFQHSATTLAYC